MKASPSARSWIAAGVRHELFLRVLPALRHDMAAPVSVLRMGLLMLKRQVAAPGIDAAACAQRVALIDEQLGVLVDGIRSLRDWELAATGEGIGRAALVAQCTALLGAAFDLGGIAISVDPALEPADDAQAPRWPAAAALRYLTLGALCHLHDSVPRLGAIHIEPDGADALRLRAEPRAAEAPSQALVTHRAPRSLAIDAVSLQCLAEDLGHAIRVERTAVRFALASA